MIKLENKTGDKDYYYRRSCQGKQNHADPVHALCACVLIYRQWRESVFAYKCQFCPNYHVGHINKRVREFIQDFVGPQETIRLSYTLADSLSGVSVKPLRQRSGGSESSRTSERQGSIAALT